jgi:hypothetical protein
MKTLTRIVAGAAVALSMTATAQADVDFSGKTIEWTIPFSETGGSANGQISLPHFYQKICQATRLLL